MVHELSSGHLHHTNLLRIRRIPHFHSSLLL